GAGLVDAALGFVQPLPDIVPERVPLLRDRVESRIRVGTRGRKRACVAGIGVGLGLGQGCSIPLVHLADICGVVIGQAICDVGDTDPSASGGIARRCDCTTAAFAVVAVAAVT